MKKKEENKEKHCPLSQKKMSLLLEYDGGWIKRVTEAQNMNTVREILRERRFMRADPADAEMSDSMILALCCKWNFGLLLEGVLLLPDLNPNVTDGYGLTPLQNACSRQFTEIIKLLLEHPKVDVNAHAVGKHPLMCLIERGNTILATLFVGLRGDEIILTHDEEKDCLTLAVNESSTFRDRNESLGLTEFVTEFLLDRQESISKHRLFWRPKNVAADYYALIVFLCDGLLQIPNAPASPPLPEVTRFFSICKQLPLELQALVSLRAVEQTDTTLLSRQTEMAFRRLAKRLALKSEAKAPCTVKGQAHKTSACVLL